MTYLFFFSAVTIPNAFFQRRHQRTCSAVLFFYVPLMVWFVISLSITQRSPQRMSGSSPHIFLGGTFPPLSLPSPPFPFSLPLLSKMLRLLSLLVVTAAFVSADFVGHKGSVKITDGTAKVRTT